MGISERREREKNERRRVILNSAKELILVKGVEHLSMEELARKAELSKATIYLYFSGKEALLKEMCDESAHVFLEYFRPIAESGLTGFAALKQFWHSYVTLFGNSDEMLIIYLVRNFLNPGQPFVILNEDDTSDPVSAILTALKTIIDQCKDEGIFDPNLDSDMATRLVLSMFSGSLHNATRMPLETRKSPAITGEITNAFQIVLQGFACEGIDRSCLGIQISEPVEEYARARIDEI